MNSNLVYRPEIDSLRALSVGAVIIYHAAVYNQLFLPGGYLGVDIFFVISGYLISSLIFREFFQTNTFIFSNFFERRARRILPALLFVILLTIPLAFIYIYPISLVDFAKSILSTLGFSSNLYFFFIGQEYAAESGLLKPLLHTWSLSVEEQFYILFPIILLLCFKYFKNYLIIVITIGILLSLFFAEILSIKNPSLNFYILTSRAWELLFGSLVALLEIRYKKKNSLINSNIFVSIGLIIIILSFFLYDESISHPTFRSLPPVIGTVLILYFANSSSLIVRLMSFKLFTGIGLISYSLYLWHFPVFAFVRLSFYGNNIKEYLFIGFSIFILSILSYLYVERPYRSKKRTSLKFLLTSIFSAYLILIFISINIINKDGYQNRFPDEGKFNLDNRKYKKERLLNNQEIGSPIFKENNQKKVLIIGNSNAQDLFNSLYLNKELFKKYQFSLIKSQVFCFEQFFTDGTLCNIDGIKKIKASRKIKNIFSSSEIIIIGTAYKEKDFEKLDLIIKKFKKLGKKVILISQTPNFYYVNARTLIDHFYIKNKRLPNEIELIEIEEQKFNSIDNSIKEINKKVMKAAIKNKLKVLDKKDLLCQNELKRCFVLSNEKDKIHEDGEHITISGANFVGKRIFDLNWLDLNHD
jgi:peptidoglycan/LPS O-acetylase OafA/YrhL